MPKYEKEYFFRKFDWDNVHFRDHDVGQAVTTALQRLGAVRPTKAVYTSRVVEEIVQSRLLNFSKAEEWEQDFDQAGELGSWLEYQAKRGIQPYASYSFATTEKDPDGIAWSMREWFGSFTVGKVGK